MREAEVIVVGAGVLGTFHAYFAARKGYRTLLIERNALPDDASTRNFGMIAPSITAVGSDWAAFARASAEIYRGIQGAHDITARETGSLYLASTSTEDAVLQEYAAGSDPDDRCSYLEASAALARYPFVRPSYCAGALLLPRDLTLDPRHMLPRLIPYVVEHGPVEYLPHTTITRVERAGQACRAIAAGGEVFQGDRVIICSGAEYRTLFPDLLRDSGLRLCKLQMMQTVPLPGLRLAHALLSGWSIRRYPGFAACPSHARLQEEPMDEYLRAHGIHVLCKQTADGSVVLGDSHEYAVLGDAAPLQERTDPSINAAILRAARTMLDLPSWDLSAQWNGYFLVHPERQVYTETIDGLIHVVTGIGGKGMTTGPAFARAHVDALLA
jgi:FAD dependent oxidoreductase TIGR03364